MRFRKSSVTTKRRTAAAAVEFAVIATILSVITLGLMEMARGMMVKETLSNAARRGCRTAILPTGTSAGVKADITKVLTDHGLKYEDATVQVLVNDKAADAATAIQNDKVAVKVSIPVSKVSWITPFFFSSSSIESEKVVMMRQR